MLRNVKYQCDSIYITYIGSGMGFLVIEPEEGSRLYDL